MLRHAKGSPECLPLRHRRQVSLSLPGNHFCYPLPQLSLYLWGAMSKSIKHLSNIIEDCLGLWVDLLEPPPQDVAGCVAATQGGHNPLFQVQLLGAVPSLPGGCSWPGGCCLQPGTQ